MSIFGLDWHLASQLDWSPVPQCAYTVCIVLLLTFVCTHRRLLLTHNDDDDDMDIIEMFWMSLVYVCIGMSATSVSLKAIS